MGTENFSFCENSIFFFFFFLGGVGSGGVGGVGVGASGWGVRVDVNGEVKFW